MKCPKCQFENPEEAAFCIKCAAKLEIICPDCGKPNPPGSNFCIKCAYDLAEPKVESTVDLSFEEKLDKAGAWKFRLAQELKGAGLQIDLNNAL